MNDEQGQYTADEQQVAQMLLDGGGIRNVSTEWDSAMKRWMAGVKTVRGSVVKGAGESRLEALENLVTSVAADRGANPTSYQEVEG